MTVLKLDGLGLRGRDGSDKSDDSGGFRRVQAGSDGSDGVRRPLRSMAG